MRAIVFLLMMCLIPFNSYAEKGGRWASSSEDGNPRSKKKTKPVAVEEVDTSGPVMSLPSDMVVSATTAAGAVVFYTANSRDAVDGAVTTQCDYASGSVFSLGQTQVNCWAEDASQNITSNSFLISVIDDVAPIITLPAPIEQDSSDGLPVIVNYSVQASDQVDTNVTLVCLPSSGSSFSVGTTMVACEAMDDAHNTSTATFSVMIADTTPPTPPPPEEPPVNIAPVINFFMPAVNTVVQAGDGLEVEINASDADGFIEYCNLYKNGNLIRRESYAPYQWNSNMDQSLAGLVEGSFSLVAECFDDLGLSATAELAIVVEAAPVAIVANVLLDWVTPTTREDGTYLAVSEIDAYEIYYYLADQIDTGTSSSIAAQDGLGGLVTSYEIEALASGNYYFSIATIDTNGSVSRFADPINLVLP